MAVPIHVGGWFYIECGRGLTICVEQDSGLTACSRCRSLEGQGA